MASARVLPPPDLIQWEVEFPRALGPPKGQPERYWSVARGFNLYEYVRGMIVECFAFHSFSLIRFMQPRRSAPKDTDDVTVARDPGRVSAILYIRLATSICSLVIILPIHIHTITCIHVCNRIPIITICIPMRPNAVIRVLTMMSVHHVSALSAGNLRHWNPYTSVRYW